MRTKTLIYGLVALVAGGTLITMPVLHTTQAQTQNRAGYGYCSTGMGMMNQQQVDQHFIIMMIPHHQGAIDMANLALIKAKHPELKKLSEAIISSQTQEIQQMKDWYKKWYGTEVPTTSNQSMGMMGMMNMNIDLTILNNAANFDQAFIQEMIPHHQMAVMMASMVLDSPHPELRNLGKAIIEAQSAEIEQMWQWQQAWSE